jgi:type I restriction enzyme R subunit
MQEAAMENPTIVVITDRNDLDGQLFGVFSLAQDLLREQPVQADTRRICAQAGQPPVRRHRVRHHPEVHAGRGRRHFPVLSDRHNIVVIADEAHRTQYGFEAKLKTTLKPGGASANGQRAAGSRPSDYRVALSGRLCPAPARRAAQRHLRGLHRHAGISEDRDTRAVFGDYIHVYDMQQAKEDGATVAIYFESRLAKLSLKQDELPTSTTRSMNWPRTRKRASRPG